MHIYANHCYCRDSIWGESYDCRYIVSIKEFKNNDIKQTTIDWTRVVESGDYFDVEQSERVKALRPEADENFINACSMKETYRLKPEVRKWLDENVKDRQDEESPKGWAVGTDKYNSNGMCKLTLFFHRKTDALAFIRAWSEYPKPETDFNYFRDRKMRLNLETMRMQVVDRF